MSVDYVTDANGQPIRLDARVCADVGGPVWLVDFLGRERDTGREVVGLVDPATPRRRSTSYANRVAVVDRQEPDVLTDSDRK